MLFTSMFGNTKVLNDTQNRMKGLCHLNVKGLSFAILVGTLMMSGCATKPTYRTSGPTIILNDRGVPNVYQVKSGDTVSQIARQYGLNYRQVGALNRLDNRYTIYAGQWLRLWDSGNAAPVAYNNNKPSYNSQRPVQSAPPSNSNPAYTATANSTKGYAYPTGNKVVKNYNAGSGELSMWFEGREGDPVIASKEGQVLYAGNGLPEYGNLIMIKHDEKYITVYAHNKKLLVKEGEQVKSGQRIATMGSSGQTNQTGLQFQVRENGNPIDPRAVLGR